MVNFNLATESNLPNHQIKVTINISAYTGFACGSVQVTIGYTYINSTNIQKRLTRD